MDKKDEKILIELTLNSRTPLNQLAKKVGISREVATYRLNKLTKEKIILDFYTVLDAEALGFSRYGCFFQLKGISHEKEKEFMDYLVKHNFVAYMGPVIGQWNIIFDIFAKDNEHLQKILQEIVNKIEKYIEKYSIIIMGTALESFPIKIFGSKKEIEYKKSKEIKLDKKELKKLNIL